MNNTLENSSLHGNEHIDKSIPVVLEFGTIASLFFNEDGVRELLKSKILHIPIVRTIKGIRADLIFGIEEVENGYFELRCVITTPYGTEYLDVYLTNLESFTLKHWMHICTCEGKLKKLIIDRYPELYVFNDNLRLL